MILQQQGKEENLQTQLGKWNSLPYRAERLLTKAICKLHDKVLLLQSVNIKQNVVVSALLVPAGVSALGSRKDWKFRKMPFFHSSIVTVIKGRTGSSQNHNALPGQELQRFCPIERRNNCKGKEFNQTSLVVMLFIYFCFLLH